MAAGGVTNYHTQNVIVQMISFDDVAAAKGFFKGTGTGDDLGASNVPGEALAEGSATVADVPTCGEGSGYRLAERCCTPANETRTETKQGLTCRPPGRTTARLGR